MAKHHPLVNLMIARMSTANFTVIYTQTPIKTPVPGGVGEGGSRGVRGMSCDFASLRSLSLSQYKHQDENEPIASGYL